MAFTHNFRPPDARAGQNFEIIKGTDFDLQRCDEGIGDVTDNAFTVEVGEVIRYIDGQVPQDTVYKVDHNSNADGAEIIGVGTTTVETDEPAGIAFDAFNSEGIVGVGFPDAAGRGRITTLHGSFVADLKVSRWFVTDVKDLQNTTGGGGTPCPGIATGDEAHFLTVAAGRRVIAIKGSDFYGVARCALATIPIDYANAYAGASPLVAEAKRDASVIGRIKRVYTGDDGADYASIHFKFSGKKW